MSLRLRLVVVFFLLSVVPLAAVTFYTYRNNVTVVHEAAQREADLVAAELSQRLQLVTAELSLRVGEFVTLASTDSSGAPVESAGADGASLDAAVDVDQVRDVLGEMAVLLDNVEVFDRRFRGRRNGPPPGWTGEAGGEAPPAPAPPVPPAPPEVPDDPTRIVVDMTPIRREILRQYVPDGRFDQLSPEERARVFSEVQQRMLGIRQGIDILRQEVTERAAAAATAGPDIETTPVDDGLPGEPVESPETLQRRSDLSSGRIEVSLERNGEVLSRASAGINLRNLLDMVFTNTPRAGGDVPFAVGQNGYIFAPGETARETVRQVAAEAVTATPQPVTLVSPEWVVVTRPDPTRSVGTIGIARPLGPAIESLRQRAVRNALVGLGFIGLALIGIVPLAGRLTRNLDTLGAGVNRIAAGDYSARIEVRSGDEVGRLAAAFNHMAAEVESHRRAAVEQERIRRELELGRQIQTDMLPRVPLRFGATEVTGLSVAAREVGGDFFNYFALADGTLALLMGDVSGKGVGAALLMANIQGALRTRLTLGQDLAALAHELDIEVDANAPRPIYVTLFAGILDPRARRLRWVNAGHNPQYVVRAGGGLERMESTGRPIGLLAGGGYEQRDLELFAGDLLFFYTDGCVEAEAGDGVMFGTERLEAVLEIAAGKGADEAIALVRDAIGRFRGGRELQDDATLMVARVG